MTASSLDIAFFTVKTEMVLGTILALVASLAFTGQSISVWRQGRKRPDLTGPFDLPQQSADLIKLLTKEDLELPSANTRAVLSGYGHGLCPRYSDICRDHFRCLADDIRTLMSKK